MSVQKENLKHPMTI